MSVIILGGQGQLGNDCQRVFGQDSDVVALGSGDADITDAAAIRSIITRIAPDTVINCAAFTQVDACESNSKTAYAVNADGARNVAEACHESGALMVHVSTDYVFDGTKEPPESYSEGDAPSPLSVYGKSKLEGEKMIQSVSDRHVIVRTAWLYGMKGNNFLKTMLKLALARPGEPIRVVDDQFGSPTWTLRLALQIQGIVMNNGMGIYHATSEGYCSWYELSTYFLKRMDVDHKIVPCTTAEFPRPARRPGNSILENARLKRENIHKMTGWRHGVDQFVSRFRSDLITECS